MKGIPRGKLQFAYGVGALAGKLRGAALAGALGLAAALSLSQPAAAGVRLAALGDSLTQGYGLDTADGLVAQLEDWLRVAGHEVTLINAGVSGDTTAGGLARLDWTLADEPDAMLVALGGNDLLRGIEPAASRANLDAILSRLGERGIPALLVGMPAPGNYGAEYEEAFVAMYADLAEAHSVAFYPDLLQPITERVEQGLPFAELMQDDFIHPNAEGVAQIVEGLGPVVSRLLERLDAEPDA